MTKHIALAAALAAMTQLCGAQEIGLVATLPDASGNLRADLPARPDGEVVYIVRGGQQVAAGHIRSDAAMGDSMVSLDSTDASKVRIHDRISLTPTLSNELPLSAYHSMAMPAATPMGGGDNTAAGLPSLGAASSAPAAAGTPAAAAPPVLPSLPGAASGAPALPALPSTSTAPPALPSLGAAPAGAPGALPALPSLGAAPAAAPPALPSLGAAPAAAPPALPSLGAAPAGAPGAAGMPPLPPLGNAPSAPAGLPSLTGATQPAPSSSAGLPSLTGTPAVPSLDVLGPVPSAGKPGEKVAAPTAAAAAAAPEMAAAPPAEEIAPIAPQLTPRSAQIVAYPEPAVTPVPSGGAIGPYGPGLAAAAPVGTPYLRSPAFAGPPVIYMPQTVTRVLVPGITPYPSDVMHPPAHYIHASAPYLRTDVYVNLPYGTYYWPQGYAGTAPVEPQVPAYATAPSTAIMTNEAAYSTQRYDHLNAHPEVHHPLAAGAGGVTAAEASAPAGATASSMSDGVKDLDSAPPAAPAPPTSSDSVLSLPPLTGPGAGAAPAGPPAAPADSGAPTIMSPTGEKAPMPGLGAALGSAPAASGAGEIIVDDGDANAVVFEPDAGWTASKNPQESHKNGSRVAKVDGAAKKAIFTASVPVDGEYEVYGWWLASNADFRPTAVPVTIDAKDGQQKATVDQTKGGNQWNLIGKYKFAAGPARITIGTEGLTAGTTLGVSADAVKLVRK